ncbi:hypothetical protein TI39_contig489g00001 [Zymoseptoria brevis]|uniref:Uncharacterized protein n=1 Tax=Zymoseptoria brevis TaxID=1047168 RepID=A0A0F4GJN5_9PEZI|nr:hypothetical protein TI39_contig489g00001 [Zymoseptoria brevis]
MAKPSRIGQPEVLLLSDRCARPDMNFQIPHYICSGDISDPKAYLAEQVLRGEQFLERPLSVWLSKEGDMRDIDGVAKRVHESTGKAGILSYAELYQIGFRVARNRGLDSRFQEIDVVAERVHDFMTPAHHDIMRNADILACAQLYRIGVDIAKKWGIDAFFPYDYPEELKEDAIKQDINIEPVPITADDPCAEGVSAELTEGLRSHRKHQALAPLGDRPSRRISKEPMRQVPLFRPQLGWVKPKSEKETGVRATDRTRRLESYIKREDYVPIDPLDPRLEAPYMKGCRPRPEEVQTSNKIQKTKQALVKLNKEFMGEPFKGGYAKYTLTECSRCEALVLLVYKAIRGDNAEEGVRRVDFTTEFNRDSVMQCFLATSLRTLLLMVEELRSFSGSTNIVLDHNLLKAELLKVLKNMWLAFQVYAKPSKGRVSDLRLVQLFDKIREFDPFHGAVNFTKRGVVIEYGGNPCNPWSNLALQKAFRGSDHCAPVGSISLPMRTGLLRGIDDSKFGAAELDREEREILETIWMVTEDILKTSPVYGTSVASQIMTRTIKVIEFLDAIAEIHAIEGSRQSLYTREIFPHTVVLCDELARIAMLYAKNYGDNEKKDKSITGRTATIIEVVQKLYAATARQHEDSLRGHEMLKARLEVVYNMWAYLEATLT